MNVYILFFIMINAKKAGIKYCGNAKEGTVINFC